MTSAARLLAVVLTGATVGVGCAAVRQTLGRELVPVETEIQLGQKLAGEIETQHQVLRDAEIQRYVRFLAQPLIEQAWADRPGIDYRITVLDAPDQVNAFALPGGPMYVYTGLLLLAANEAEVVGVLAHELGHVVGRHSANQLATQFGLQLLVAVALGEDPAQLGQMAAELAGAGAMARFSRDDEREADDYGVRYAIGAGYDPWGTVEFFHKMRDMESGRGSAIGQLLASHPATDERIARLEGRIAKAGDPGGKRNASRYVERTAALR